MPSIKVKKLCQKHGFYTDDKCSLCIKESNKIYDTGLRAKDRQKIYNDKRWKEVRMLALIRDNFLCVSCLNEGIETKAEEVDHKIELSQDITLAFDLDNLQCLCKKCHSIKTQKEREKRINL